jgi:hypothetical protein
MATTSRSKMVRSVSVVKSRQDPLDWEMINSEKERQTPTWLAESMWDSLEAIRGGRIVVQSITNIVSSECCSKLDNCFKLPFEKVCGLTITSQALNTFHSFCLVLLFYYLFD